MDRILTKKTLSILVLLVGYLATPIYSAGAAEESAAQDRLPRSADSIVSFSGGAIEFSYDSSHWTAQELPHRRQVLLVLREDEAELRKLKELPSGIWLGFVPRQGDSTHRADDQLFADHLTEYLHPRDRIELRQDATISGLTGQRYVIRGTRPAATPSPSPANESNSDHARGERKQVTVQIVHYVLVTRLGWYDIESVFPVDKAEQGEAKLAQLLTSLKLADPSEMDVTDAQETVPSSVVGSWKSLRGTMQLTDAGEILLRWDRPAAYTIGRHGLTDFSQPVTELSGKYKISRDTLEVTWEDGSRLNMAFRTERHHLLLTDHHGRVCELARLFTGN